MQAHTPIAKAAEFEIDACAIVACAFLGDTAVFLHNTDDVVANPAFWQAQLSHVCCGEHPKFSHNASRVGEGWMDCAEWGGDWGGQTRVKVMK